MSTEISVPHVDNPPLNLMSQGVIDGFEEAVNEISQADIRPADPRRGSPFHGRRDVHIFEGSRRHRPGRCSPGRCRWFARLEELPLPTVVAVQGLCLAAGLEWR